MGDIAKIRFLWNAGMQLPASNHTEKLLKSYYLTLAKKEARNNEELYNKIDGAALICKRCSYPWHDGSFSLRLHSAVIDRPGIRDLIESFRRGDKLAKKRRVRAKWYIKKALKRLDVTCHVCRFKNKFFLEESTVKRIPTEEAPKETLKVKSKRLKKDKSAGLILPKSFTLTKNSNISSKNNENEQVSMPKETLHKVKVKIAKNKNTIPKNIKRITPKLVSKTQQKNTLLQLATMLKRNESSTSVAGTSRLKNFLE